MPAANLEPTTLPRVQGRHKNHVLAARRRIRAVELASRGLTYQAIADELGYANRGDPRPLAVAFAGSGTPCPSSSPSSDSRSMASARRLVRVQAASPHNLSGANFPVSCVFWHPRNRRLGSTRATTFVCTGRWSTTSVSRYSADPGPSIVSSCSRLSYSARASSPVLNQAEVTPLKVA